MKNKKIFMYVIIILILLIIIGVGYFIINKIKNNNFTNQLENEYIPQEEITDKQLRQTLITLYFLNPEKYELVGETRQIDAKELINNPYEILINLLIEGPQNENNLKLIPNNTKLNSSVLKNHILYIDFSKDLIKEQNLGKEQEELIIKSIVYTVTELTEVEKVVFLIDEKEGARFPDNEVIFNKAFTRN